MAAAAAAEYLDAEGGAERLHATLGSKSDNNGATDAVG